MKTHTLRAARKKGSRDLPVEGRKAAGVRGGYLGFLVKLAGTKAEDKPSGGGAGCPPYVCENHNETLLRDAAVRK